MIKPIWVINVAVFILALYVGLFYPQAVIKYKELVMGKFFTLGSEYWGREADLFTKEELAQYNGKDDKPIYLALLGNVYDVTRGRKHYGPDCSYNYFVGRDASVAFITGEFEKFDEETADDVNTLPPNDLLSLANWKLFYDKDYNYKGKLVGRFYDHKGRATNYLKKFQALLEQARELKTASEQLRTAYPDCNIAWSEKTGTRVWCTKTSGGKQRDWVGFPRKLYEIGSNTFRCACVHKDYLNTTAVMLKPYDECDDASEECFYRID